MKLPKIKLSADWWLATMSSVVGTVIGIVLTLGTNLYFEKQHKKEIERTAVLMVVSNIDDYCRKFDGDIKTLKNVDSVSIRIMNCKPADLKKIDNKSKEIFLKSLFYQNFNIFDRSAEKIFSSSIDIWENIDNSAFIMNVGKCYSLIESITKGFQDMENAKSKISERYGFAHNFTYSSYDTILKQMLSDTALQNTLLTQHSINNKIFEIEVNILKQQNERNKKLMNINREEYEQFQKQNTIMNYNFK